MASIPCAAYQASHIHAHIRRQNMARARHPSTTSTDSTAEDVAPPTDSLLSTSAPAVNSPITQGVHIQQNIGVPTQQHAVSLRDQMDRVSQWVGESYKRWRNPLPTSSAVPTGIPQRPEESMQTNSVPRTGGVIKSDN